MEWSVLLGTMVVTVLWTGLGVALSIGSTDYRVVESRIERDLAYQHVEHAARRWIATWHPAFRAARRVGRAMRKRCEKPGPLDVGCALLLGLTTVLSVVCIWTWPTWVLPLHAVRTETLRRWVARGASL
jgi:hypothetical protein